MAPDDEPLENLGGGYGNPIDAAPADQPRSRAAAVVDRLGERYWRKAYGDRDAFNCLIRTILSQNTSDVASQPAYDALVQRFGGEDIAAELADATHEEIVEAIKPAGLYNRKATVITGVAETVISEYGGTAAFDAYVRSAATTTVRERLLAMDGIGPKTADCVLLFAGGRHGVFPVDTHIHRIYRRLGIARPDATPEEVRCVLETAIPPERCGFGHTTSIQFGREFCTARRPACVAGPDACPLYDLCDRVGVDLESESVIDPAATVD